MSAERKRYRLVTRSDMDGLVCAILLRELGMIHEIRFAHPKDVQDGKISLNGDDITTNLPYVPDVHLAFDHHSSETIRVGDSPTNRIIDSEAPSAARVVFNHFGGRTAFPEVSEEMLAAVDKADSAQYAMDEILDPSGWVLLGFLMDARTGLGRFKEFRISNYALMMDLIEYCKGHTIEEILALPDVAERVDLYMLHRPMFEEQIRRCSTVHGNLVVLDLRSEETIYAGNRFMVYALYPESNVSMHVMNGLNRQNTVFAVGKSIFDRSARANVGELMLEYGGGGHDAAGTCQISNEDADRVKGELIERLTVGRA